jgi:alpha-mannosidase
MLLSQISFAGIRFSLAPAGYGKHNAVIPRGQTITLPTGSFNRLYILAASAGGDVTATFHIGNNPVDLTIQDWSGYIGQWDNRIWKATEVPVPARQGAPAGAASQQPTTRTDPYGQMVGLTPGFIKPALVAWFASHRHASDGSNEPYAYSYLFAYAIDVPEGAMTLTLPSNERIRILAITVSDEGAQVRPVQHLTDYLER